MKSVMQIVSEYFNVSVDSMLNKTGHAFSDPRNVAAAIRFEQCRDYKVIAAEFNRHSSFFRDANNATALLAENKTWARDIDNIRRIAKGIPPLERFSKVRRHEGQFECECSEWFDPRPQDRAKDHDGCDRCRARTEEWGRKQANYVVSLLQTPIEPYAVNIGRAFA